MAKSGPPDPFSPKFALWHLASAPPSLAHGCSLGRHVRAPLGREDGLRRSHRRIVADAHTHVRALPVPVGSCLVWSHRLIHWGSAHAGESVDRKTLAFALADPAFEPPLLRERTSAGGASGKLLPEPRARLAIIAHLLVRYHHEASHPAPLWPSTLLQALTILLECADHLSDAALEWYSSSTTRASPVAQGSVLQLNLANLHRELTQSRARHAEKDDVAKRSRETVEVLAVYIVHTRALTACDELSEIARARGGGSTSGAPPAEKKMAAVDAVAEPAEPAVGKEEVAKVEYVYEEVD